MYKKTVKGLSLIEILIVVTIFSILGIITTRAVLLTVGGSKKTEAIVRVRENLNYSFDVVERQIRNADSVVACASPPNPDVLTYVDGNGEQHTFSCLGIGTEDGYIASDSARLTNNTINVTACSMVCTPESSFNPPSVTIDVTAVDKETTGVQSAQVTSSTKVFLRSY